MRASVVGAGFAGLVISRTLAELGYRVKLYEEHSRVGYPPHCTGIVSQRVVDTVGKPALEAVLQSYSEVVFKYKESEVRIKTRQKIYKLDRELLEELMLEEVASRGVNVKLGSKVDIVDKDGKVGTNSSWQEYDIVFLAEGHRRSLLKNSLGIDYRPLESVGLNIEVKTSGLDDDAIIVVFDENLIGRGFYWVVPIDVDRAVIGALSLDRERVVKVLEHIASKIGRGELRRYGGIVIHGPPLKKNPLGRVVVVGDAAGYNKPLTGGGLYPNSIFAESLRRSGNVRVAVRTVARRLSKQYPIARILLEYPELTGLLVEVASEYGVGEVMERKIDFDEHESLISSLVSRPRLVTSIMRRLFVRTPAGALRLLVAGVKSLIGW